MSRSDAAGRLAAVPPATLGLVVLCLLQSGVDRVDPTAGQVERVLGLLLLAFAVSGFVTALVGSPPPAPPGGVRTALFLRGGLVLSALLLLLLVLTGARLNPLADLQFVVSLLLLALLTTPVPRAADRVGDLLARAALPLGLLALAVSVPLTFAKLFALP